MRLFVAALVVCSLLGGVGAVCAPSTKPLSEDELKLQKLADATKARELYVLGEAEYKKGNLEPAIRAWAQALDLKPDSTYTKQCLAKARNELYKRYTTSIAKELGGKDFIDAMVTLDSLVTLLPDKADIAARRTEFLGQLTGDQRKGLDSYNEALSCMAKQNYTGAKKAISNAQIYARQSSQVNDLARRIDTYVGGDPVEIAAANSDGSKKLPMMYDFYATWCGPCKRMEPVLAQIEQEYAGKIVVKRFDVDKDIAMKNKYQITAMPTLIILDTNGKEICREVGGLKREHFLRMFQKAGIR